MGNGHPVAAWSTRSIVPARQFSSWREAVSETHLAWDLPARPRPAFRALITPRLLGPANVVERWIWQQRLLRCHRELLKPAAGTISDVAFRWGFSDAAHFSRAFKAQFGPSPRQLRRQAAETLATNAQSQD